MRSFTLGVLFTILTNPLLQAEDLRKAYFAATQPGTWAKYESNWKMADGLVGTNTYTYTRISDSASRVRIEVETETMAGPGEGMITRQLFIMGPEFDLARDFLNRMEFLQATVSQVGDGEPSLMQENVIEIMRQSAGDFTNSVTFKGQKEVQGFACDLYAYSFTLGGPHATVQEGEICLGETVPFGIVYQKGRVNGTDGAPVSSFEQKLLDSGAGKSGTEALLALTPETGPEPPEASPSLAFMDAYESGKIRLVVEVVEGTGGERLDLTAVNTTNDSIDLVVPGGPLAIPADSPLGVLNIVVREEQQFSLSPGGSGPALSVGQTGDRGATAGKFNLVVYEGQPLYQGSVTVGPLE
jgi:hypothetical protein